MSLASGLSSFGHPVYILVLNCCFYFLHHVDIAHFTVIVVTFSDTFNENTPPTDEPAYISSLGSAIYEAMSRGNKNAVWLMQVCSLFFYIRNVKTFCVL